MGNQWNQQSEATYFQGEVWITIPPVGYHWNPIKSIKLHEEWTEERHCKARFAKPRMTRGPPDGMEKGSENLRPSGKRLDNHGKSPFLMGTLTISMAMFIHFHPFSIAMEQ